MNETVNQETNVSSDKTFTQAELDAVVKDRLKREREKYADYEDLKAKAAKYDEAEEASKSELQKMTDKVTALQSELDSRKKAESVREIREKVAKDKGIPATLLTSDTEEDCIKQADSILEFAHPGTYPNVKDGGETRVSNGSSTRQQFADWVESNL